MQYKDGEAVRLWVNKVGPYDNPQETYNYYYLPFCAPTDAGKPKHKWGGLGEVLQGNELIDSQLDVKFKSELHVLLRTACHCCSVHTVLMTTFALNDLLGVPTNACTDLCIQSY